MAVLFLGMFPSALQAHQFYISITTIQHYEESGKLTVRVKVFVNDLEESIYQERGVRIGIWKNKPVKNAPAYVERYITSKLAITINGKTIPLKFKELKVKSADVIEDNVIICQFESYNVPKISKIEVRNRLLVKEFETQANIVNVLANDSRKTINLDKRLPEDEINYKR